MTFNYQIQRFTVAVGEKGVVQSTIHKGTGNMLGRFAGLDQSQLYPAGLARRTQ